MTWFLVDMVTGIVLIRAEKLAQVKCQLQSFVGLLLYIIKCAKPAKYFVNWRKQEVLRNAQNPSKILFTDDYMRDLSCFKTFWTKTIARLCLTTDQLNVSLSWMLA